MTAPPVEIPVGPDRFAAMVLAEACRAEGIRVELLTADAFGVDPLLGRIQQHKLLVRPEDVPRVQEILGRSGER
jgi:hypothetical protein